MQDSSEYRVIDHKKFAVLMMVLLSVVAVAVWVDLDQLAEYLEQLEELAQVALVGSFLLFLAHTANSS
jgi:hypothetical protein